jgi:mannose-6-phosphate isomerase
MDIFRLDNTVKHYAWGSPEWIPALTGKPNPGKEPWAELWMGIHGEGPSKLFSGGKKLKLGELIASSPAEYLGEETASEFGNLPFLLKFLAAAGPLSIQAHPNLEQAKSGWERENSTAVSQRNYRDPNHKPEIICALGPFTAMAGFRPPAETERLLSAFFFDGGEVARALLEELTAALSKGYREFLSVLFGLNGEERQILDVLAAGGPEDGSPEGLCRRFSRSYPGDPGILSPLYLNVIELRPFQAMYIPAGMLHAYVHGLGVECMANSDNVLRGGLTPKHIDLKELFDVLRFEPHGPEPAPASPVSDGWERYAAPCREFTLFHLEHNGQSPARLAENGAAVVTAVRGTAVLSVLSGDGTERAAAVLKQGEAAFIPRRNAEESLAAAGDCSVFAALAP